MSERPLLMAEAVYFGLFAVWPLLHMRSFLAVSGPKVDLWLVRTVSWLLLCSAVALAEPAVRGPDSSVPWAVALGNPLALLGIDVYYVAKRRIWRAYLLDAAVEVLFLMAWTVRGLTLVQR